MDLNIEIESPAPEEKPTITYTLRFPYSSHKLTFHFSKHSHLSQTRPAILHLHPANLKPHV